MAVACTEVASPFLHQPDVAELRDNLLAQRLSTDLSSAARGSGGWEVSHIS